MSAPRVVHLVYDLIRGGTEGQCARVAMGLARRGLPHRVAVFHRRGFFLEAVEAACGPVRELPVRHLVRAATWRAVTRFAEWLREERADLLHAWDAEAAIFGQFAAARAGIRLVTSRRDLGQIYPSWKQFLLRRADRRAARVVANAQAIRAHFAARGLPAGKIEVVPNLLDLEEFDALAARAYSGMDRLPPGRRLVVVNRLDPEKNTGVLVDALPRVRKQVPDAALIIAGDGPEMPGLRAKSAALGLGDAVCFLGEVHEVPALLRQCEIGGLVPCRNEGLSNTILEYMAAGLPVLATDCGGNRELVQGNATGRLLPAGASAEAVGEGWIALLQDPSASVAMGRRGRETVERQHSRDAILDAFQRLYAGLGAAG